MEILTKKQYRDYDKLSRYSSFPYYYNRLDDKYIEGTTSWLRSDTSYSIHKVELNDTYDSIALRYYNSPLYYWIILDFNHIQDPFKEPEVGTQLKIPVFSTITYSK